MINYRKAAIGFFVYFKYYQNLIKEYSSSRDDEEMFYLGCAYNKLGLIYMKGNGVSINLQKSESYFQKAIDYSNECNLNLGILYENKGYVYKCNLLGKY